MVNSEIFNYLFDLKIELKKEGNLDLISDFDEILYCTPLVNITFAPQLAAVPPWL